MKNRYKVLLAGGIIEIGLLIGAGFVKYGILIWLVFNCLCVLSLLLLRFLNRTIKKTEWYKNLNVDPDHTIFPDNTWYREHDERNYDVVNLGSSSGKWAFNYSIEPIKGMNWAIQPQTLVDDFKILKNFHSILKNEGYVLITIMPFTGLNKKTGLMDTYKYLGTLDYTLIDPKFSNEAYKYRSFPFLFGKRALKEAARYLLGKDKKSVPAVMLRQEMTAEELERDAARWMNGWKHQFNISDFDAPLTEENKQGRLYRIKIMRQIIDFCTERSYIPILVIPPVTDHLSRYYTPVFEQTYVYDYIRQIDRDIKVLDYSKCIDLKSDDLYFNSFFFNEVGAHKFTHRVLRDLGLVQEDQSPYLSAEGDNVGGKEYR